MNNEKTNLDLIRDFMFVLLLCPAGFAAQSGRKKSKRDTRGGYLRNFRQVSSDVKKRIAESTPGLQFRIRYTPKRASTPVSTADSKSAKWQTEINKVIKS